MSDFVKELCYIRRTQKEFRERFGRELIVDIAATKGCKRTYIHPDPQSEPMEECLESLLEEYGTTRENLQKPRCSAVTPEGKVLRAFAREVVKHRWNKCWAAKLIYRHRRNLYHLGDIRNN